MDQSLPPDWSPSMGVNPNNLLRDHVPQYPAGLEHLSPDGDLLDEMDAAYDYLTDLGNPHQDFLALAGPDENMRPQHARMLVCASLPQDTGACQLDEQFDFSEPKSQVFQAATDAPHQGYGMSPYQWPNRPVSVLTDPQLSTDSSLMYQGSSGLSMGHWPVQPFSVPTEGGSQTQYQAPTASEHTISFQTKAVSLDNSFPVQGSKREKSRRLPKAAILPASSSRNRKFSSRRSPPQKKIHYATTPFTVATSVSTPLPADEAREGKSQEVIDSIQKLVQPYSEFSQRIAADIISQLEQMVVNEQKYGNVSNAASSSQDSMSTADKVDSHSLTDDTSVSSATQQSKADEDHDDSMSIDEVDNESKHDPCASCGFKTLYYCARKHCGYATHSLADYKRHEEGDKHWPQDRFMCLECPTSPAPVLNGEPVCQFCLVPRSLLGLELRSHYLDCNAARKQCTAFSRKDHLVNHLRKEHPGIADPIQVAGNCRYAIDSRWPRQCGFCGIRFETWPQRQKHLAEHFQNEGLDMSSWKLPFPKSTDTRPQSSILPKDNDDNDEDDSTNGSGRSGGKLPASGTVQPSKPSAQSHANAASGRQTSKRSSAHTRQRASNFMSGNPCDLEHGRVSDSVDASKPSLTMERYLNDTTSDAVANRLTLGGPDELYCLKPSGFRPNPPIVGRRNELEELNETLFVKKQRVDGQSNVVLQGVRGCGKSELAMQYASKHKDDFSGGVFWVRAKTEAESVKKGSSKEQTSLFRPKASSQACRSATPDYKYKSPKHPQIFCNQCRGHPIGFRGEHELRRHKAREHSVIVKKVVSSKQAKSDIQLASQRASEHTPPFVSSAISKEPRAIGTSNNTKGFEGHGQYLPCLSPSPQPEIPASPATSMRHGSPTLPSSPTSPAPTHGRGGFENISTVAEVNIVLVHGLNGKPANTWTSPDHVNWPRELLPTLTKPFEPRIMTFGYDAVVCHFGSKAESLSENINQLSVDGGGVHALSKLLSLRKLMADVQKKSGGDKELLDVFDMIGGTSTGGIIALILGRLHITIQHAQSIFQNLVLAQTKEEIGVRPTMWTTHSLGGILLAAGKARPYPECMKAYKDLDAHIMAPLDERPPQKCPIQTCQYHTKEFASKYDKDSHTLTHYKGLMVCDFCPGSVSAAEKSFDRADVFKRHLLSIHGVEHTPPHLLSGAAVNRRRTSTTLVGYAPDATGKCSTCSGCFSNTQKFYDHLDDCVVRAVQRATLSHKYTDPLRLAPSYASSQFCGVTVSPAKQARVESLLRTYYSLKEEEEKISSELLDSSKVVRPPPVSDQKSVKPRTRKRLSPVARAKAALMRELGSCPPCRARMVKCPLEHHNLTDLHLPDSHTLYNSCIRPPTASLASERPMLQCLSCSKTEIPVVIYVSGKTITFNIDPLIYRSVNLKLVKDFDIFIVESFVQVASSDSVKARFNPLFDTGHTPNFVVRSTLRSLGLGHRAEFSYHGQRRDDAGHTMRHTSGYTKTPHTDWPLAIVGMSSRFPSAADTEEFCRQLEKGLDAHHAIPKDRFGSISNINRSQFGSVFDNPDIFDPRFFNMSVQEAEFMDSLQRLALTTVYENMEMAVYKPHSNQEQAVRLNRLSTMFSQTYAEWKDIGNPQHVDLEMFTDTLSRFIRYLGSDIFAKHAHLFDTAHGEISKLKHTASTGPMGKCSRLASQTRDSGFRSRDGGNSLLDRDSVSDVE